MGKFEILMLGVRGKKITQEEAEQKSLDAGIRMTGKYKGCRTKTTFECPECHRKDWEVLPTLVWDGYSTKCRKCFHKSTKLTQKEAEQRSLDVGIRMTGKYKGSQTKTTFECSECGNEWEARPGSVWKQKTTMCRECFNKKNGEKKRKTGKEVREKLLAVGCEWIDGEYKNNCSKLTVTCAKCGEPFKRSYRDIVDKKLNCCRSCGGSISMPEERIIFFLDVLGIKAKQYERPFPDMKHEKPLEIDITVYDDFGNITLCIEYNGEQHYKPVKGWGGKETFETIKLRDRIKCKYLHEHNIPFLVIPYWQEEDIEKIVFNNPEIRKLLIEKFITRQNNKLKGMVNNVTSG